jgi:ATP-dependent DNA helicase RecG
VLKRAVGIKLKTEVVPSLSQVCPMLDSRNMPIAEQILVFCSEPHSLQEIMEVVNQTNRSRFKKNIINPLLVAGVLSMTIPDKPNSPLQQYYAVKK